MKIMMVDEETPTPMVVVSDLEIRELSFLACSLVANDPAMLRIAGQVLEGLAFESRDKRRDARALRAALRAVATAHCMAAAGTGAAPAPEASLRPN